MNGFGVKLNKFITDISTYITNFINGFIDLITELKDQLANLQFPTDDDIIR